MDPGSLGPGRLRGILVKNKVAQERQVRRRKQRRMTGVTQTVWLGSEADTAWSAGDWAPTTGALRFQDDHGILTTLSEQRQAEDGGSDERAPQLGWPHIDPVDPPPKQADPLVTSMEVWLGPWTPTREELARREERDERRATPAEGDGWPTGVWVPGDPSASSGIPLDREPLPAARALGSPESEVNHYGPGAVTPPHDAWLSQGYLDALEAPAAPAWDPSTQGVMDALLAEARADGDADPDPAAWPGASLTDQAGAPARDAASPPAFEASETEDTAPHWLHEIRHVEAAPLNFTSSHVDGEASPLGLSTDEADEAAPLEWDTDEAAHQEAVGRPAEAMTTAAQGVEAPDAPAAEMLASTISVPTAEPQAPEPDAAQSAPDLGTAAALSAPPLHDRPEAAPPELGAHEADHARAPQWLSEAHAAEAALQEDGAVSGTAVEPSAAPNEETLASADAFVPASAGPFDAAAPDDEGGAAPDSAGTLTTSASSAGEPESTVVSFEPDESNWHLPTDHGEPILDLSVDAGHESEAPLTDESPALEAAGALELADPLQIDLSTETDHASPGAPTLGEGASAQFEPDDAPPMPELAGAFEAATPGLFGQGLLMAGLTLPGNVSSSPQTPSLETPDPQAPTLWKQPAPVKRRGSGRPTRCGARIIE